MNYPCKGALGASTDVFQAEEADYAKVLNGDLVGRRHKRRPWGFRDTETQRRAGAVGSRV